MQLCATSASSAPSAATTTTIATFDSTKYYRGTTGNSANTSTSTTLAINSMQISSSTNRKYSTNITTHIPISYRSSSLKQTPFITHSTQSMQSKHSNDHSGNKQQSCQLPQPTKQQPYYSNHYEQHFKNNISNNNIISRINQVAVATAANKSNFNVGNAGSDSSSATSSSPLSPPSVCYNIGSPKEDGKSLSELSKLYKKSPFMQRTYQSNNDTDTGISITATTTTATKIAITPTSSPPSPATALKHNSRLHNDESPKKESVLSSLGKFIFLPL